MKIKRDSEESATITFTPKDADIRFTPDGSMVVVLWDAEDDYSSATFYLDPRSEDQDSDALQHAAENRLPVMLTGKRKESSILTKDGRVTVKRFDATAWKIIPF